MMIIVSHIICHLYIHRSLFLSFYSFKLTPPFLLCIEYCHFLLLSANYNGEFPNPKETMCSSSTIL